MDAREPRLRRRGFFLHSSEGGEPDTGEHENPEGFIGSKNLDLFRVFVSSWQFCCYTEL